MTVTGSMTVTTGIITIGMTTKTTPIVCTWGRDAESIGRLRK
jgi:hypothetical protein